MPYNLLMLKNVEIYSKSNCTFCDKAKNYFNQNDIPFTAHNAEIPEIFEVLMSRNPHARTMPQIFINDELIGGYTDLIEWLKI
jgi:glutaredoxin 3